MPDWVGGIAKRLPDLTLDPVTSADVMEELAQHLDLRYRELIAGGLDERTAELQAWGEIDENPRLSIELANTKTAGPPPAPIQNTSHAGLHGLWDDAAFAWRRLRHAPGFALLSLATITLTIGVNTSVLSVADAVLFRPLPYRDPNRLVILQMRQLGGDKRSTYVPYALIDAINDGCPNLGEMGLLETARPITMTTPGASISIPVAEATPNYFEILGVTPAVGRILGPSDKGREGRAAMLSYAFWQNQFGGEPSVVGRTVRLGSSVLDVVGVLPPRFVLPSGDYFAGRSAVIVLRTELRPGNPDGTSYPIARLTLGTSFERAQAEVDAAVASTVPQLKDVAGETPVLEDVRTILYPVGRPVLRYLLVATGLILLLGCANLANLMLLRGRRHERDTAVRLALGATRARLIRPLAIEALILSVAGAGLAALIGWMTFDALLRQIPRAAYGLAPVGVSGRVVAASFMMGAFTALLFGLVPAWRAANVDVLELQRRRPPVPARWWNAGTPMVAAQVAIAVAVAFGAAVAARTFASVLRTPLGFSPDRVALVSTAPPPRTKDGPAKATDAQAYYEHAVTALRASPAVAAVGAVGTLPFSPSMPAAVTRPFGSQQGQAGIIYVLPGYFEAAGIALLRGHLLAPDDVRSDPDAAVVSELAARVLFDRSEPIGGEFENRRGRRFHVVGVVADVLNSLSRASEPQAYVIPGADLRSGLVIVARLRDQGTRSRDAVSEALRDLTLGPPLVEWWSDSVAGVLEIRDPRFQLIVLGTLASVALGLTSLGVFGIVAFAVSARTREMGVRLAIGSSPAALVWLVIRQSLPPLVLGTVFGLVLVRLGRGLAEAQFYKVDVHDPLALAGATGVVLLAAIVAAYLPARRAAATNPVDALRSD